MLRLLFSLIRALAKRFGTADAVKALLDAGASPSNRKRRDGFLALNGVSKERPHCSGKCLKLP